MKLLTLTTVLTAAASAAFADPVAFAAPATPAMMVEETGAMGGAGLWLLPLIAIALILFAVQGSNTDQDFIEPS